ncbi:MAG: DNA polymerase subunit Cdc27 [Phormidesmis priestleyi Ana]|uniref:DNA polymerase subunit Cdc27 n=1 Tax=Phormidesmis priestleyi Ana TaxID=1666911 RepID=A0A0P7Z139_9CYAN|nr:MAG: DNA polymerase subunit Cdc27 [Phormidesmis priestleyi Ana]
MSDPVLSQLVAVEDDLSQQVENLESQLAAIESQRLGLRTVIDMFQKTDDPAGSEPPSAEPTTSSAEKPSAARTSRLTTKRTAQSGATADKAESTPPEKPPAKKTSKTPATTPSKKTKISAKKASAEKKPVPRKTAQKKKKDGRAADWQKYVQSDFGEAALPEAVSSVLRAQPSEIFAIADVMSSIFTEDMPRDAYLKARNRISNILSGGARDGTWYRGRNGRYSQSESVTKSK